MTTKETIDQINEKAVQDIEDVLNSDFDNLTKIALLDELVGR